MRDHDRTADHEADAERLEELLARDAGFAALGDVIADAIVATQYQGCDQTQQLLGLGRQRAILVRLRVEREEAAHDLVVLFQDALVHALAELHEFVDAVAHDLFPDNSSSLPSRAAAASSS